MTDLGLSILKGSFAGVERGRFEGELFLCGVDALVLVRSVKRIKDVGFISVCLVGCRMLRL